MAEQGVVAELDLVISQQATQQLGKDIEKVGQNLGTGIAAQATPAARDFAVKLIAQLSQDFKSGGDRLAKDLADGTLSPAQYTTKAAALGAQIRDTLQKAISAGGQLNLFEGEGGAALRTQLQALDATLDQTSQKLRTTTAEISPMAVAMGTATAGANKMNEGIRLAGTNVASVGQAAVGTAPGLNHLKGALISVASTAAGVPGPVGRIISLLLQFGIGSTVVVGFAAAAAIIATAWDKITAGARKARKETEDFVKAQLEARKQGGAQVGSIADQAAAVQKTIDDLNAEFARLEQSVGGAEGRQVFGGKLTDRQKEILEQLPGLNARLKQLTDEATGTVQQAAKEQEETLKREAEELKRKREALNQELVGVLTAATLTATDEIRSQMDQLQARFDELGANVPQSLRDAFQKGMAALQNQLEGTTVLEAFAQRMKDIDAEVVEGLGSAALQNIIGELDALRAQIEQTLAVMPQGQSRVQLEEQRNAIIARRNVLQQQATDLASTENLTVQGTTEEVEKQGKTHEEILTAMREQARLIEQIGHGALALADALGIVDDNSRRVLDNLVSIGANLPAATHGDPGAIIAVATGVVNLFKGPDRDPARLAENQDLYQKAIAGDPAALERLLMKSGPTAQGGWHSQKARDDALRKYQDARKRLEQDAAAASKTAADESARAEAEAVRQREQAQREHLEGVRTGEEQAVAARTRAELDAEMQKLLTQARSLPAEVGAIVSAAIAQQKAADEVAKRSELGAEGPEGRDAQRRADEARRAAEEAVAGALRDREEAVTPGFTVRTEITRVTGGEIVGNLVTIASHTSFIPEIFKLLGGVPAGAPGGNGAGRGPIVEVPIYLDRKLIGRAASEQQQLDFQGHASLGGNAEMPG